MQLSDEDERSFQRATVCHICKQPFDPLSSDVKVRDHDHLKSGRNFWANAHNYCNINYKNPSFTRIFLHNARGYDMHLLLSQMGDESLGRIRCILNHKEK